MLGASAGSAARRVVRCWQAEPNADNRLGLTGPETVSSFRRRQASAKGNSSMGVNPGRLNDASAMSETLMQPLDHGRSMCRCVTSASATPICETKLANCAEYG